MASLTLPKQSLVILLVLSLEMVIYTYKQLTNNDRFAKTEAGGGEFNPHNHKFKEQKNPFESALRDVTALARENESTFDNGGKRTRPHFNLTEWTKKTSGGLKDLDRIKLAEIYRNANSVFEWGLGESSFIAAQVGVPRYTGIDSDPTWIKAARDSSPDHFRFHLGDIGPTGSWGRPEKSGLRKGILELST
jgi:hypothetical protein